MLRFRSESRPRGESAAKISVLVNGVRQECEAGATLLDILQDAGVDLPTLCHDPRVKPCGSCRMCLVEVKGSGGSGHAVVAACTTEAVDAMDVRTHTPELEAG